MRQLTILVLVLASNVVSAQGTFQRMVLSDDGIIHSMDRDATGNLYTATLIFADSANFFYGTQAVKYDPDGSASWHIRLSHPTGNRLNCQDMAVSAGGEVVMIYDLLRSSGFPDSAVVTMLNANGGLVWARSFLAAGTGNRWASGQRVTLAANGDILAGGVISSTAGGLHDEIFLARLNASGTVIWAKSIGTPGSSTVNRIGGIVEDATGTIMVFGQTAINNQDSWLLRLSSTGEPLWCLKYHTPTVGHVRPLFLAVQDAGYALFYNAAIPNSTDILYRLTTDGTGVVESSIRYVAEGRNGQVLGVTPLMNGGYALAGYTKRLIQANNDAMLFTTDGTGAVQWGMQYGGDGAEGFDAVEPSLNGSFLAAGLADMDSLTQAEGVLPTTCYLVMTDANGLSFGCEAPLNITSTYMSFSDSVHSLTVTDVGGWANAAVITSTGYEEVAVCPSLNIIDVELPALGLYPNPANDLITLSSATALHSVRVLTADARVMSQQRMDGLQTVDVRTLAPGAYLVLALDVKGHAYRGRFVKE